MVHLPNSFSVKNYLHRLGIYLSGRTLAYHSRFNPQDCLSKKDRDQKLKHL